MLVPYVPFLFFLGGVSLISSAMGTGTYGSMVVIMAFVYATTRPHYGCHGGQVD